MNVAIRLYSARVQHTAFLVEDLDLPGSVPTTDVSSTLDRIAQGTPLVGNGQVLNRRHLTVRGDPALDLTTKGALYAEWRYILHGRRVYVILGEAQSGPVSGYAAFRDSFVIARAV